jgi:hypothetical protein
MYMCYVILCYKCLQLHSVCSSVQLIGVMTCEGLSITSVVFYSQFCSICSAVIHTASTSQPLLMSLNLRDTGCIGDQTVRIPWICVLVENPLKRCCDKLYYVTLTTHN